VVKQGILEYRFRKADLDALKDALNFSPLPKDEIGQRRQGWPARGDRRGRTLRGRQDRTRQGRKQPRIVFYLSYKRS
jgi:hypothetical protein